MRIVLYILIGLVCYQILMRLGRKLWHFPAPAFIGGFLDSDLRRALQPAAAVILRSGIEPGNTVLEIGCGSGAYILTAARTVKDSGKVFALDIQPGMLTQLKRKLARPENADVRNVRTVQAGAYNLPFEEGAFDVVCLITVLQEIPDRKKALSEIMRVLRPGGTVAVTEWIVDPDYVLKSSTMRLLKTAGFERIETFGNLWTYTVRGRKEEQS